MKLTPEGPSIVPNPEQAASLSPRRIATHTLNISVADIGTARGSQYLEAALAAFRNWVSENTGNPVPAIYVVLSHDALAMGSDPYRIAMDAYVLVGNTYRVPTHHFVRYRRNEIPLTPYRNDLADAARYVGAVGTTFRNRSLTRLELAGPFPVEPDKSGDK